MPSITFNGQLYQCKEHESVLDCLTAHGVTIPSSCHAGLCQTCLMVAVKGKVPASAQFGLRSALATQQYFLACMCYPDEDIEIALSKIDSGTLSATVVAISPLNSEVLSLKLQAETQLNYRAGQFINLYKEDAISRSYSLASVPEVDEHLHFHIRKLPGGQVSQWVHQELKLGDRIKISEAKGDCFYSPDFPEQNLLLIATGTGLAPLFGIVRDALRHSHKGAIKLYHGSSSVESIYLTAELKELASMHKNFVYTQCISSTAATTGFIAGRAHDIALKENTELSGWRVFLCGHPEMVSSSKKQAYLAGAALNNIYADPFIVSARNNLK